MSPGRHKNSLWQGSLSAKRENFAEKQAPHTPSPYTGRKWSGAKADQGEGGAEQRRSRSAGSERRANNKTKKQKGDAMERAIYNGRSGKAGQATVRCKSKTRVILIPAGLRKILLKYIRQSGRQGGAVFVTKSGQGVSAQPAPSVRPHILQRRKGHREAGGYARAQQYQHHPYLHGRKQSPPQGGTGKDG